MNWRAMTNEEMHDYAVQLWGEARAEYKKCGGNPDALNKLFLVTESLIQEKKQATKKHEEAGEKTGLNKRNLIIGMAITELRKCNFDWKKMRKMVWRNLPPKMGTEKTMRETLEKNRGFIESAAKGSKPGK